MRFDPVALDEGVRSLARRLLERRAAPDHWDGFLASSALSTGTAILALHLVARKGCLSPDALRRSIRAGTHWLAEHQNADGGWGDTVRSLSNISTTAIVWASLAHIAEHEPQSPHVFARAEGWLREAAGDLTPEALRSTILRRYGNDRTFSVPILTVLALAGRLGADTRAAWRSVPQLPFELAALPHGWFQHLRLPVVSYALPALIAIGQVRHRAAPSRNPAARALRDATRERTHRVLLEMQPASGGYLEATPLTSFVVMSLAGMERAGSPVVERGVRFLLDSMRADGSWPIDTNLATWVTSLSIGALAEAGGLPPAATASMQRWLLDQQSTSEHPFTHAAPGAWAWTPLSGGVPDADDTSGALIALSHLGQADAAVVKAAAAGARWLLGVQNRDGGVPTFCRGWGALPFDRSTPEITAHAVRAWSAWCERFDAALQTTVRAAAGRALDYLESSQEPDGSWVPLWFGNEHAPGEHNPVYGTARVLLGLNADLVRRDPRAAAARRRGIDWLLRAQNEDGGWGGSRGVCSSVEETGVALSALARQSAIDRAEDLAPPIAAAVRWLLRAVGNEPAPVPCGLYFARLWYFEELYPLIFALEGLSRVRASVAGGTDGRC